MNAKLKTTLIHSGLFLVTLATTTIAGAEWVYGKSILMKDYSWNDFLSGFSYSIPFLFILTAHEFGHYFTAISYRIRTTLPYYIPFPPAIIPFNIGTFGAVIRLKGYVRSKQQHFDIGIAGPLAGFVAALIVLVYAYTHLPPLEYIYQFHPEYQKYGADYASFVYKPENMTPNVFDVVVGKNLLFLMLEKIAPDPTLVPNVHEIMHYPFIFAGFLSLVFTAINLLPVGQLDGGHVLYGLIGSKRHKWVSTFIYIGLLFYAGTGLLSPKTPFSDLIIYIPLLIFYYYLSFQGLHLSKPNTLTIAVAIFAVQYTIAGFVPLLNGHLDIMLFLFIIGRFAGIHHPPSEIEEPLTFGRKVLGWMALLIFVLCFTPNPIDIIAPAISK
jgi:membrane-associated protease RseP (regulator of RpoE activity)